MTPLEILIVDDDRFIRELLGQICGHQGASCHSYATLKEARQAVGEQHFDAAIIDGLLPDGNGLAFAEELSQNSSLRGSILFLSAFYKDIHSYQKLKSMGVAKVLHKPIAPQVLEIEIEHLLQEKRATTTEPMQAVAIPSPTSTPVPAQSITKDLEEICNAYRGELPRVESDLVDLLFHPNANQGSVRSKIREIVHNLSGVAGMCGFPELSNKASPIDHRIDAGDSIDSMMPQFEALISEIRTSYGYVAEPELLKEAEVIGLCEASAGYVTELLFVGNIAHAERLAEYARAAHITMRSCPTVSEAGKLVQRLRPDAALVDRDDLAENQLGELVSTLRNQMGDSFPIVCISEDDSIAGRIEARAAGIDLYYIKPIEPADVHRSINEKLATQQQTGSILIVDDDPAVGVFAKRVLDFANVNVRAVTNPEYYWQELEAEKPTVILMDLCLPVYSGFELCAVTKSDPRYQDIPLVVISSHSESSSRMAAFKAGADEYLIKPLIADEFRARVLSRLRSALAVEQVNYHDRLTGLLSRGAMEDMLQRTLLQTQREATAPTAKRKQHAVLLFDIDDFKSLNDTAGHLVGDQGLRIVAHAFQQALRSTDYVARWGGEEFLALIDDATPALCRQIFQRIITNLSKSPVRAGDTYERVLTLSAGAAMLRGEESLADVIDRADAALYQAKGDGKKRLVMASTVSLSEASSQVAPLSVCC